MPDTAHETVPLAGVSEAEWALRCDLAACYRLAEKNRMSKVVWNHITARVPGKDEHILVNRFGLRYDEITASNLLKIDLDGNTVDGTGDDVMLAAYVIHSAVHKARPDVVCAMHTHSRGGLGVSALQEGLLPLSQESMLFFEAVGYHGYEGMADDVDECDRLAANLGSHDHLILLNHGLLTVGRSVGEAYWRMALLEMSCQHQMEVLATGRPYVLPPRDVCLHARRQSEEVWPPGVHEWPALRRQLDRDCPDYKT